MSPGGRPYISVENKEIFPLIKEQFLESSYNFQSRGSLPQLQTDLSTIPLNEFILSSDVNYCEQQAKFWTEQGMGEHSSIASFAIFSQKLMAVGAPMEIIKESFLCGEEEMVHANLSFELASLYRGKTVKPSSYDPHSVTISGDIEELLISTIKEACIQETIGAFEAAKKFEIVDDLAVKQVWKRIARDEAYHASYGWRVVQWIVFHDREQINRRLQIMGDVFAQSLKYHQISDEVLLIREIADKIISKKQFSFATRDRPESSDIYKFVVAVLKSSVSM